METAAFGHGGAGLGGDRTSYGRGEGGGGLARLSPHPHRYGTKNASRRDRKNPETVAVAQQKGRKDEEVRTWTIKKAWGISV